jgi:hypothetical protein
MAEINEREQKLCIQSWRWLGVTTVSVCQRLKSRQRAGRWKGESRGGGKQGGFSTWTGGVGHGEAEAGQGEVGIFWGGLGSAFDFLDWGELK